MADLHARLEAFNQRFPDQPITSQSVRTSVRERARIEAETEATGGLDSRSPMQAQAIDELMGRE